MGKGAKAVKQPLHSDGAPKVSNEPGVGDAPAGLPPRTLSKEGWPDLPGKDAQNFNNAKPVLLPEDTKLYRVTGPTSNPAGSYWTRELPGSEAEWRNNTSIP